MVLSRTALAAVKGIALRQQAAPFGRERLVDFSRTPAGKLLGFIR